MLEVCQEEIFKEIKESTFVAAIANETSNVSSKTQLAVIFRYLVNMKPIERFWRFLIPEGRNATSLTACLLKEFDGHLQEYPEKHIAQTYDGASIMAGFKGEVQAIVKEKYAQYIHCHAHQLNLIMLNAASINRSVKVSFR